MTETITAFKNDVNRWEICLLMRAQNESRSCVGVQKGAGILNQNNIINEVEIEKRFATAY